MAITGVPIEDLDLVAPEDGDEITIYRSGSPKKTTAALLNNGALNTDVATLIQHDVDIYGKANGALQNAIGTVVQSETEEIGFTFDFLNTNLVYSGWGTNISAVQGIDCVVMRIQARTTAITSIRYGLFKDNVSGTKFVDEVLVVNIPANTDKYIVFPLGQLITNVPGDNLYFIYNCNQLCNRYGATGGDTAFPTPSFELAAYSQNGVQTFTMTNVVGGQLDNWFKAGLITGILSDILYAATQADALTASDANLRNYFDNSAKINFTGTFIQDGYSALKTISVGTPTKGPLTGTFSGWGSAIGTPANFNGVRFLVSARLTTITSIVCRLKITNTAGSLIVEDILQVNIPAGTSKYVCWVMSTGTYVNGGGNKLFFEYLCDQQTDLFQQLNVYTTGSGNGQTVYWLGGSQSSGPTNSSTQYNTYVETGIFIPLVAFTPAMLNYLITALNITPSLPTVEIHLNSQIYAVESLESNIYLDDSLIFTDFGRHDLTYTVVCTKGLLLKNRWTYLPVSSDAGTTSLIVTVYYKGVQVAQATSSLITKALSAGGGTRPVLIFGDSTLSTGQYLTAIHTENPTPPTISFQGTINSGTGINHEGRAGWTLKDWATFGRYNVQLTVSGVITPPIAGATYTDGGIDVYTVISASIVAGSGNILLSSVGGYRDPHPSTMHKTGGTGDATFTFSATTRISINPLWNPGSSQLDFGYYATNAGYTMTTGWIILFNLGLFDLISGTDDVLTLKGYLVSLVGAAGLIGAGINIGVGILIPPTFSQDGFGSIFPNGLTLDAYQVRRRAFNKMVLDYFDTNIFKGDHLWTVPFNHNVDRENNFTHSLVDANSRNITDQEKRYSTAVLGDQSLYDQMGDALYGWIKSFY